MDPTHCDDGTDPSAFDVSIVKQAFDNYGTFSRPNQIFEQYREAGKNPKIVLVAETLLNHHSYINETLSYACVRYKGFKTVILYGDELENCDELQ